MKSKKLEALKLVAGAAAEFCAYEVAHSILKHALKCKPRGGVLGKIVVGVGIVSIASAVGYFAGKAVEKQIDETVDAIEEMKEEIKKARENAENDISDSETTYIKVPMDKDGNFNLDDLPFTNIHSNDFSNCKVNLT